MYISFPLLRERQTFNLLLHLFWIRYNEYYENWIVDMFGGDSIHSLTISFGNYYVPLWYEMYIRWPASAWTGLNT